MSRVAVSLQSPQNSEWQLELIDGKNALLDGRSAEGTVEVVSTGVFEDCVPDVDCARDYRIRWTPRASARLPARWVFKAGFAGVPNAVEDPNILVTLEEP
ncbi:MAG: hypothetical protein KA712_12715 [Myxococcales bacterium]|nr:hypothetical protein [Myxococcales bacterium]